MTRIHAYVLIADPSFLRESLMAYYPYVDRIVLSYDRTSTSWTGTPLPVAQCLKIVEELDSEGKCVHAPGDFARLDHWVFANETFQRQAALDAASEGADWVLQLDTDEVMGDPDTFFEMLGRADRAGAGGLDFPARWLYTRTGPGRYLESSTRLWRRVAGYPGPLAVRAGTRLRHARQADVDLFRVDLRERSTDPARPKDAPVDAVISPEQAVLHFSWVRDPDTIRRKFGWSGHTAVYKPPKIYRRWAWRTRHPLLATLMTPLMRGHQNRFRLAKVAEPPGGVPPVLEFEAMPERNS
ncbi:hypothetical protein DY023_01825 [Microbacterium bovistercoris]|uniref:Glycosyltransferase family 2 protein n=1 Tax=Microbacterium bovistercoris TaxID=2293570 RepID=A0A371NYP5_9MICO|nr:hypothetical protein [Microbacterium bovistercoris]REJ08027.1 hypothetical protein DY023_01825 [Microbacterium bovistercoris]